MLMNKTNTIVYSIRTNIGEEVNLANWWNSTQSPSLDLVNIFFYSVSIMTLVAFEWFRQINISPNPYFQQIAQYYIRQYLFLYGISKSWTHKKSHKIAIAQLPHIQLNHCKYPNRIGFT